MTIAAWYDVAGGLGAAVGGIGAAVGAGAAWKSASASRDASRDALQALGLGIAPAVSFSVSRMRADGDPGGLGESQFTATVVNHADFAARDLQLQVQFAGGRKLNESVAWLAPGNGTAIVDPQAQRTVVLADAPAGGLPRSAIPEVAELRYRDERGIFEYVQRF